MSPSSLEGAAVCCRMIEWAAITAALPVSRRATVHEVYHTQFLLTRLSVGRVACSSLCKPCALVRKGSTTQKTSLGLVGKQPRANPRPSRCPKPFCPNKGAYSINRTQLRVMAEARNFSLHAQPVGNRLLAAQADGASWRVNARLRPILHLLEVRPRRQDKGVGRRILRFETGQVVSPVIATGESG